MIELCNVTKSYPTLHGRRYVFRDLSFAFPDDVSIGVMGRNGAGKSTLLNLIGGIDAPDRGEVRTNVSVSWPVGLSRGFQRDLSARENVAFVCRLYGADRDTLKERVAFVREFSEIGDYFDLPMSSYSAGMRSRVAFGLSMAFEFDYYLIDEAMAVGDPQFKRKSRAAFEQRMATARMILVSHNASDIREYCDIVVLVEGGQAKLYEDLEAGIAAYENADGTLPLGIRRVGTVEPARERRPAFLRRRNRALEHP